jgi:hypothetical protein
MAPKTPASPISTGVGRPALPDSQGFNFFHVPGIRGDEGIGGEFAEGVEGFEEDLGVATSLDGHAAGEVDQVVLEALEVGGAADLLGNPAFGGGELRVGR